MRGILQIMKRTLPFLTVVLLASQAFAAGVNDYPAGLAASGIAGSRHNMGSMGKVLRTTATTEICVFCHTPHHTNTTNGLKPMWNRGTSAPTSYTAYGATIGGSTVNNTDIGSTSLACLSCHDGVMTFDNIVNAPGKGGVVNGGSDRGWTFAMPIVSEFVPMGTYLHKFDTGAFACNLCHYLDNPAARLSLGMNLSDDHPVSVAYSADRAGLRPTNTTINSIDLTSELASSAASYATGNIAQNRWAVKGFISDTATISDLLRDGRVECSSCHDPHFKNLSWDEVEGTYTMYVEQGVPWTWCSGENCSDGQFLRRVGGNTGSGVCRTCHEK
ncbi:MAG: hypothetical protein HY955_04180 [Deltaproteobacteria bacterium]|nr:hypothetical protein [Deltaproteobacteria bacterium]